MKEPIKIYVDRLREGDIEEISEILPPDFMDVHEQELLFEEPITLDGEAYVADDFLIISLNIQTHVTLICSVCNEPFSFDIDIQNMMHDEPLENIRDKSFDLLPLVRENILLEIPLYPQCGITECKRRSEIEPFLKADKPEVEEAEEPGYNPFKDLL